MFRPHVIKPMVTGVENIIGAADAPKGNRRTLLAARRRLRRAMVTRLLRDRRGTAAIEMAMIGPVFALVFVGIVEVSTLGFASTMLETAATDAARLIRTGQLATSADPLADFTAALCGGLPAMIDCGKISIDVRNFTNMAAVDLSLQLDEDGNPTGTAFAPGGPEQITLVRVAYRWDFFTPLIGTLMSDNGTNSALLLSTAVFQNEPYAAS